MFNAHKKFPKIKGFHNVVKEVRSFPIDNAFPTMNFRSKNKLHGCVDKNTLVSMSDGSQKAISELSIGDSILSYNLNLKCIEEDIITNVIYKDVDKAWLRLDFSDGSVLNCTEDHLVFTLNRGYVEAVDLTDDDEIVSLGIS